MIQLTKRIKTLTLILVILILIMFLYPKYAGFGQSGFIGPNGTVYSMKYSCFGIKYSTNGDMWGVVYATDIGTQYWCSGISYDKKCYALTVRESDTGKLVPCESLR